MEDGWSRGDNDGQQQEESSSSSWQYYNMYYYYDRYLAGGGEDVKKMDYNVLSVTAMTLALILLVEVVRHQLDHSACHRPFFRAVLEGVYAELATLGIVEFCLHLLAEYYPNYDKDRKAVFADVHFLLFYTAILNAFQSVLTAIVSTRVSQQIWVQTEMLELNHYVEIREEFQRVQRKLDELNSKRQNSRRDFEDGEEDLNKLSTREIRDVSTERVVGKGKGNNNNNLDDETDDNNNSNHDVDVMDAVEKQGGEQQQQQQQQPRHSLVPKRLLEPPQLFLFSNVFTCNRKGFTRLWQNIEDQIRYPHLRRKYNDLLVQIRFHELRVHFLHAYDLPLKLKISDYLIRSEQNVLIKLVHISNLAWLLLTGGVCLMYYVLGMVYYQYQDQELMGTALTWIFFGCIAVFVFLSWLVSNKMQRIFHTIMHEKHLWDVNDTDLEEKKKLARQQRNLFWGGEPKNVIAAIQFMQFGYALAISTIIIFWEEISDGSVSMFWFVLALAVCYAVFVRVTGLSIPRYTLCTSLGQLVDERRLRETVAIFQLEEAKRKQMEILELRNLEGNSRQDVLVQDFWSQQRKSEEDMGTVTDASSILKEDAVGGPSLLDGRKVDTEQEDESSSNIDSLQLKIGSGTLNGSHDLSVKTEPSRDEFPYHPPMPPPQHDALSGMSQVDPVSSDGRRQERRRMRKKSVSDGVTFMARIHEFENDDSNDLFIPPNPPPPHSALVGMTQMDRVSSDGVALMADRQDTYFLPSLDEKIAVHHDDESPMFQTLNDLQSMSQPLSLKNMPALNKDDSEQQSRVDAIRARRRDRVRTRKKSVSDGVAFMARIHESETGGSGDLFPAKISSATGKHRFGQDGTTRTKGDTLDLMSELVKLDTDSLRAKIPEAEQKSLSERQDAKLRRKAEGVTARTKFAMSAAAERVLGRDRRSSTHDDIDLGYAERVQRRKINRKKMASDGVALMASMSEESPLVDLEGKGGIHNDESSTNMDLTNGGHNLSESQIHAENQPSPFAIPQNPQKRLGLAERVRRRKVNRRKMASDGVALMASMSEKSRLQGMVHDDRPMSQYKTHDDLHLLHRDNVPRLGENGSAVPLPASNVVVPVEPQSKKNDTKVAKGDLMAELVKLDTESLRATLPEVEQKRLAEREDIKSRKKSEGIVVPIAKTMSDAAEKVLGIRNDRPLSTHDDFDLGRKNPRKEQQFANKEDADDSIEVSHRRQRRPRMKAVSDGVAAMAGLARQSAQAPTFTWKVDNTPGLHEKNETKQGNFSTDQSNEVGMEETDNASLHSNLSEGGYSDLDDIPETALSLSSKYFQPLPKRILTQRLYDYFLSKNYPRVSNVFGTILAFFMVGERVEGFLHTEEIILEDEFVSLYISTKYTFWFLFVWLCLFIVASGLIFYSIRTCGMGGTTKEKELVVAAVFDVLLSSLCLTLLCVAEAKRCCHPSKSDEARLLADYEADPYDNDKAQEPAPCGCPAFGSRKYGGLGNVEPYTSLIVLRTLRYWISQHIVRALLTEEDPHEGDVNDGGNSDAKGLSHGTSPDEHDHGHASTNAQQATAVIEAWESTVGSNPELVAQYGEFSGEILRLMLGVPFVEEAQATSQEDLPRDEKDDEKLHENAPRHSSEVKSFALDKEYSGLSAEAQEVILAGKLGRAVVRSASQLNLQATAGVASVSIPGTIPEDESEIPEPHDPVVTNILFEIDARPVQNDSAVFTSPNARLVRGMRRCDRKMLPFLDQWSVVDVILTRFEMIYFDAVGIDDIILDENGEGTRQALIATKGGKGLRLCDIATSRRVVGHLALSDIASIHVERKIPSGASILMGDSPDVELEKSEFWKPVPKNHHGHHDSLDARGSRWSIIKQDRLVVQTVHGHTLYLRFYSDLDHSEQHPDILAEEDEADGVIHKNNAFQWAQTIGRFCGPDHLKQSLPHFGDDTSEELRDYLTLIQSTTDEHRRTKSTEGFSLSKMIHSRSKANLLDNEDNTPVSPSDGTPRTHRQSPARRRLRRLSAAASSFQLPRTPGLPEGDDEPVDNQGSQRRLLRRHSSAGSALGGSRSQSRLRSGRSQATGHDDSVHSSPRQGDAELSDRSPARRRKKEFAKKVSFSEG